MYNSLRCPLLVKTQVINVEVVSSFTDRYNILDTNKCDNQHFEKLNALILLHYIDLSV